MKITAFWDIAPARMADVYRRFRDTRPDDDFLAGVTVWTKKMEVSMKVLRSILDRVIVHPCLGFSWIYLCS